MRSLRTVSFMAAALVLAAPSAALAHAAYKSSNPADGATVASPPGEITAEFTEPLTSSSSLQVFDPCGAQVDHGNSTVSGYEMSITMSGAAAGRYVVEFRAQSALDSHVTSGSFSFTSSGGDSCAGEPEPTQPPSGGGGRTGGGGGSGGGSGVGAPATQDPAVTGGGSRGGAGSGGGDGPARTRNDGGGGGPRTRGNDGGSDDSAPVAFQNTGDRAPAEPAPWDLPLDGVVIAFVLCVTIGAAGGRVYAGIVAPPRR